MGNVSPTSKLIDTKTDSLFATANRTCAHRVRSFSGLGFNLIFIVMVKDNYFLLTGAFGSGKSTLLEHMRSNGIRGIVEPARPILAEQRSINGNGLPQKDPRLFVELMFSRMLNTYRQSESSPGLVLFDRGIPDILG